MNRVSGLSSATMPQGLEQTGPIRLCWRSMQLLDIAISSCCVHVGEKRRLVMPRRYQFEWLTQMNSPDGGVWLHTPDEELDGGSEAFASRVACMLHQRSALANLSLRENIMLPVLYAGRDDEIQRATAALPGIAEKLEITDKLDEQVGERSGYMHALIALGRIMLMQPDFIVVQDAHAGIHPHRQAVFRKLFCEEVEALGAGVLYLSASEHDGSGLEFCQSLVFAGAEENL